MSFQEFLDRREGHVRKYVEYRASMDGVSFEEAARRSLGHMWDIASSPRNSIAIITAFRHENVGEGGDQGVNLSLNQKLLFDIRNTGYGSIPVAGGFSEDILDDEGNPTGKKQRVEEDSFLVNAGQTDIDKFRENILRLVRKYKQDAALIKFAGDDVAKFLNSDGSEVVVGKWNPSQLAVYYTRMKKGPPNRQFTFEAAGDLSVMTQTAMCVFERNSTKEKNDENKQTKEE